MFLLSVIRNGSRVALILNLMLDIGNTGDLRATTDLRVLAGLVLSIGMPGRNVLIHERIKQELRWGKTVRAAIDQGYHRAFSAIN